MILTVDDIGVVEPSGEIDPYEGRQILAQIANLLKYEWRKIVLDLREVHHIHYRFLSELSTLAVLSSFFSGGIKLANLSADLRGILRIVGADRHFETYDSVEEAILSFESSMTAPCTMQ